MPSIQHMSVVALCAMLALSATVSGANLRAERRLGATYSSTTEWLQSMLDAVNSERSKNGLSSLCLNSKLTSAAQGHSEDMAANNYMDHNGADGSTMSSRVTAAGYDWSYVAENVAAGQTDVDSVMTSWMNSEGHRANILSSEITMFGAGYAYSADTTYGHYWTQDFGASSVDECDSSSSSSTSTAATKAPVATTTAPTSSYDDEIQGEASSDAYTEAPATEAPATEAPATEAPATEAPVTEAPVTEAPATEAPGTVVPATEAPEAETPASNGGCKVRRQH